MLSGVCAWRQEAFHSDEPLVPHAPTWSINRPTNRPIPSSIRPYPTTPQQVRAYLSQAYPALAPVVGTVTLALNLQYVPQAVEARVAVKDGDEVALIPPISGG